MIAMAASILPASAAVAAVPRSMHAHYRFGNRFVLLALATHTLSKMSLASRKCVHGVYDVHKVCSPSSVLLYLHMAYACGVYI